MTPEEVQNMIEFRYNQERESQLEAARKEIRRILNKIKKGDFDLDNNKAISIPQNNTNSYSYDDIFEIMKGYGYKISTDGYYWIIKVVNERTSD